MKKEEKVQVTILKRIGEYTGKISARAKTLLQNMWRKYCTFTACNAETLHRMLICSLVLFSLWLLWALWLKFNNVNSITDSYYYFSPLTLRERILFNVNLLSAPFSRWWRWDEVFANSIVFAPFGVLFNMLAKKKNIWRDLAICFGISLFMEALQFFTTIGVFAVIDLVTNTVGYLFGYVAYKWIFQKLSVKAMVWFLRIVNTGVFVWLCFAGVNIARNMDIFIAILTRTL